MAPGPGDNFSLITTNGANITNSGVIDIDAFCRLHEEESQPGSPAARITRLNC